MKIYTEINYIWSEEKGQLIETSSKSYDYEGPMTLCHDKWEYIGPRRFNNKVKIPHGHQFDKKEEGPTPSEQAAAAESALQARKDAAETALLSQFEGDYDDKYFSDVGDKYVNFAMNAPVSGIRDQRKKAMSDLTFQLARQGKGDSTLRTDREALAKKLYAKGQVDAGVKGHGIGEALRGKLDTAKNLALADIRNATNPESAANTAMSSIQSQTDPGTFNPMLDVFLKLTQGLAMRQEVERRKDRQAEIDAALKSSASYHV